MNEIVSCKIHPGIGVARVGNSPDGFYVGPEAPGVPADPGGAFKDGQGRIKRQAARFRVFGYDAAGLVVRELTAEDAEITWTVHLANAKGAAKAFVGRYHETSALRNASVPGSEFPSRDALVIDPGVRSISGADRSGADFRFQGGTFLGQAVELGELRTDEAGRLLVLGGFGRSGSVLPNNPLRHYANNDGWFDDTSDGPVSATVVLRDGRTLPAAGARVLVGPPAFAPHTVNFVTLYDVVAETFGALPAQVSFTEHVYPLLARSAGYQAVSARAHRGHGPGRGGDFVGADSLLSLSDPSEASRADRESVFRRIRRPGATDVAQASPRFMPILSGDDGDAETGKPRTWLAPLPGQYEILKRWAAGDFAGDWKGVPAPPAFEAIPVAQQPAALDRAALEDCVGGPFYPGIEMTFIAGDKSFYSEPFRLRRDLAPGAVTQAMALPWQADFHDCRGHWWPAQRPDEVVTQAEFDAAASTIAAGDPPGTLAERLAAPREKWAREVESGDDGGGRDEMVTGWSRLGFVAPRRAPNQDVALVETERDPAL